MDGFEDLSTVLSAGMGCEFTRTGDRRGCPVKTAVRGRSFLSRGRQGLVKASTQRKAHSHVTGVRQSLAAQAALFRLAKHLLDFEDVCFLVGG